MTRSASYTAALALPVLLIIVAAWFYFYQPFSPAAKTLQAFPCQPFKAGKGQRQKLLLPDGTLITLLPGTGLKLSCDFNDSSRTVSLDGEAYFKITRDTAKPFIVISKDLFVSSPGGVFHFQGYASEAGEQLEFLRGSATVRKTYASQDSAAEALHPGEMIMINRSIDLMEKETFDTGTLATVVNGLGNN